MDVPGVERGRVSQVSPAGGVFVTLDRFHRNRPAGPVVLGLAAPTVAVGDHVIVACLGGSIDDLMLIDVVAAG